MATPSLYEPMFFVQLDNRTDGVRTAFGHRDVVEVDQPVGK
jgi:hypothetical protein